MSKLSAYDLPSCGTDSGLCWWMVVLITSVTINLFVLVYLCTECCLRLVRRRRSHLYNNNNNNDNNNKNNDDNINKDNKILVQKIDGLMVKLTSKYRKETSMLFTEAVFTFSLLCGSLYLLVDGAVANGFTTSARTEGRFVATSTAFFSAAIGQLVASLCGDIRRLRLVAVPEMKLHYVRQTMEHVLMLFVFVIMTSSTDAILTRTLLSVMAVDQNVINFRFLFTRSGLAKSASLSTVLLVLSAFLSLAFRGILPLVSLLVSVTYFREAILAMTTKSIAVVVGSGVVYTCHNTYAIVTSLVDVYNACSAVHVTDWPSEANNKLAVDRKLAPIDLVFNKLDIESLALRSRASEKCGLLPRKPALARLNTANRMWPRQGSTGSVADSEKVRNQNECRRFGKQNLSPLTRPPQRIGIATNTRKQTSNLRQYRTFLEAIEEETEC